ncbi:hypothetical protein [Desulfurivibrio sp. C05AmB]|uniref:hypothetical protein n=1 Tax=Desulfurivibrio sp. C05AmB TaxID=3374371 RepID=UPI00376ED9A8
MKRLLSLTLIATFALMTLPGLALAWNLAGFENANKERGQWAWFTGQAQQCNEPIPVPGAHTRAEWQEIFTTAKDKLPCGGAGINARAVKHIFLFVHEHAADTDSAMNQKPESCG